MKVEAFPLNTRQCNFEYFRVREGPNYFVSYYKNSSQLHYDPKECWRVLGVAKFTDTGKALKQWAVEMYESNLPKLEPFAADTSFASEAMEETEIETIRENFNAAIKKLSDVEEPNDNTKTII